MPSIRSIFKSIGDLFKWAEEVDRVDKLEKGPAGQYEDFLLKGKWYGDFSSSNVELMNYDYEKEILYVQFKPKNNSGAGVYAYNPVSMAEALSFIKAPSKGGWIWDNLRIRGTALGHRKNYALKYFH